MHILLYLFTSVDFLIAQQVYFQPMSVEGINLDDENTLGGEIQIERIPTCTVEAKSKDLIPVFDYLQAAKNHAR